MQIRILVPVIAILAPSAAWAGSISTAGMSSGPDGGPATSDAAAIVFNPAALGGTHGYHVIADGQLNFIHVEATATRNDGIDPNTEKPYNVATADPMVPNLLIGGSAELWKDRLVAGIALHTPFVGGGDYSGNETNPPPYTSQQRYSGINVKIISMAITPAVALSWEGFHVGGGFSYVLDSISALQASDTLGTEGYDAVLGTPYSTDSVLSGDASGHHTGWSAGIFVDQWKFAQLGVSYASAGDFHAEGDGTVDVPGLFGGEPTSADAKVSFDQPLPAVLRVGLTSKVAKGLKVGAVWEYQMWNSCCGTHDGDLKIGVTDKDGNMITTPLGDVADVQYSPRRLWNSSDISLWGTYKMLKDDKLLVGGRVGYNQNAVPSYAVSATNLDFENVGAMVAARYKVAGPMTLGLAYTHYFLFTREITNSAWGAREGEPNFRDEYFGPNTLPYKVNTDGTYSGHDNVLGVRLGVDI